MSVHPFVSGVRAGTVDEKTMHFYLEQDFLYLVHYGRAMKILSARCPERPSRLLSLVASGLDPYQLERNTIWKMAGLIWADLKHAEQAPYTRLYTDHLLATACLDPCVPAATQTSIALAVDW